MRVKAIYKKIITLFLVIIMLVSSVGIINVKASNEEYEYKKSVTTLESNTYYDWWLAVFYDGLYWGEIHRAVQNNIWSTVSDIGKRELNIKSGGRADLWMQNKNDTSIYFIWEVKPAAYGNNAIKEQIALRQLRRYTILDMYKIGRDEVTADNLTFQKKVIHPNKIETVEYYVEYENAQNGLILYNFERNVLSSEPLPENVPESEESACKVPSSMYGKESTEDEMIYVYDTFHTAVEAAVELSYTSVEEANEDLDTGWNKNLAGTWGKISVMGIAQVYYDFTSPMTKLVTIIASSIATYNVNVQVGCKWSNSLSADLIKWSVEVLATLGFNFLYDEFGNCTIVAKAQEPGEEAPSVEEITTAIYDYMDLLKVLCGTDLYDDIRAALEFSDVEDIDELMKLIQEYMDEFDEAGEAQPPRDPLIIDLGEEGIKLCTLDEGVYFDLDNNGFAEKTAWIDVEDGFLALDRNGNGTVDNGGELFGDQVYLKDGTKSVSGFQALKELDDNKDGVIDKNDTEFTNLKVWIDSNHNGKSETGELNTLDGVGVQSISLEHEEISVVDEATGTRIAERADVIFNTGGENFTADISEFWFPVNSSDTTQGDTVTTGNVPNIMQYIMDNDDADLFGLLMEFDAADNIARKHDYAKQILYYITDANEVEAGSRGGNIDAQKLKVIEEFMGREFVGVNGSSPNVNAARMLEDIYTGIEEEYYNLLNMYCTLGGYLNFSYEYEDENGNKSIDFSIIKNEIETAIEEGRNVDTLLYDFGIYLKVYDRMNGTDYYQTYCEDCKALSPHYGDIADMTKTSETFSGTGDADTYSGSGITDFILGFDGDDTLYGGYGVDILIGDNGNDYLDGGKLNDMLDGGYGDDTYVFGKDYGTDIITDYGDSNKIIFKNINSTDILVNGVNGYDVSIKIKNTDDELIIKDFMSCEDFSDYTLEFADKTVHCKDEDSPFRFIYGDETANSLRAVVDASYIYAYEENDTIEGSGGNDYIYAGAGDDDIWAYQGNDVVYCGLGNDTVNGGDGDDMLYGDDGDDVIDGSSGNDFLNGGVGNDTYIFDVNYGMEIVEDSDGISVIKLGDQLTMENISVYGVGDEAVIHINDSEDRMFLTDYAVGSENYIISSGGVDYNISDYISYDIPEGTYISGATSSDAIFGENKYNIIASGSQYDYIVGGTDTDVIFADGDTDRALGGTGANILFGGSGNDQILSDIDNDFINGGVGNDYLSGGAGDDIFVSGTGDDIIDGGSGNDTYYFNKGDGNDTILDKEGQNLIVFGSDTDSATIKAYRYNWNDLLIKFDGLEDSLVLKNYCIDETARLYKFIFADGKVFNATDSDSPLKTLYDNVGTEFIPSIYEDGIIVLSSDGSDQIEGSDYGDILNGGDLDNRILGKAGDDIIDGGLGSDYLSGGAGSDTYIYKVGYGTDTVSDSEGNNIIEISDYMSSEIGVYRYNWNDLAIVLDGSGEQGLNDPSADKIIIEGFYISENNRSFSISFADTRLTSITNLNSIRVIQGTSSDEYMQGYDEESFTLYGDAGVDEINGGSSNDYLYGGTENDRLLGNAGNDYLYGEAGDDYMEGGAGNDTYVFARGYGFDTIVDSEGINVIKFTDVSKDEVVLSCTPNTDYMVLTLTISDAGESISVNNYSQEFFEIEFTDGVRYKINIVDSLPVLDIAE